MRSTRKWGVAVTLLTGVAAVAALAASMGGSATAATRGPIVIGWAYDAKGQMAPFDNPALATARIRIRELNARNGVNGRKLRLDTCDTQNNAPARAKSCARQLLAKGAHIIFTTCDVDFATPVVQEAINRGKLAISTCIGTDQMGPKRFGRVKGRLAFSFGNVAQDEGSAMAEYAIRRGWKEAGLATNTLLVYFKNVIQAFDKRYAQLGGKVVARESYATGANNVQLAVTKLNAKKADVYVTSTAFGELPAFVSGFRTLGNQTPILNSWAGDGTYWVTQNPTGDQLLRRHLRLHLRRRPERQDQRASGSRSRPAPAASCRASGRSTGSWKRSSGRTARRTAPSSRARWRTSRKCRRRTGRSASRGTCTACSAGSTA